MSRIFRFIWISIGKPMQELTIGIAIIAALVIFVQAFGAWLYFSIMWELPDFKESLGAGLLFIMGSGLLIGAFLAYFELKKHFKKSWKKSKCRD